MTDDGQRSHQHQNDATERQSANRQLRTQSGIGVAGLAVLPTGTTALDVLETIRRVDHAVERWESTETITADQAAAVPAIIDRLRSG